MNFLQFLLFFFKNILFFFFYANIEKKDLINELNRDFGELTRRLVENVLGTFGGISTQLGFESGPTSL